MSINIFLTSASLFVASQSLKVWVSPVIFSIVSTAFSLISDVIA